MTHLTATIAANVSAPMRTIDWTVSKHGLARLARRAAESIFYSPMANFLELPRAAFHYSVIDVQVLNTLAPELGDRHISNDVSVVPATQRNAAGVRARAGDK